MRSAHLLPERREGKMKMIKQQHLPFTVLKLVDIEFVCRDRYRVATTPTVYGIETHASDAKVCSTHFSCNSTYRLRYAPKGARQQRSKATMRSAHLKYLSKAKVKRR